MGTSASNDPKFHLGYVVATAGLEPLVDRVGGSEFLADCLYRHRRGDWGGLDRHDVAVNDRSASEAALNGGARVLSAYLVPEDLAQAGDPDDRVWVITSNQAWDHETVMRTTTVLWPSDY